MYDMIRYIEFYLKTFDGFVKDHRISGKEADIYS